MAPPSPFRRSVTGRVGVVAHRGLSAEEPENTMRAFRRAAEVGCDLLEFDVHLSRDGEVVVIHDDTLERTTNGRGLVRDHSLAELRSLDAGRGERIPTLDEVARWARGTALVLSCEIKQPAPASGAAPYDGIAERVVAMLRDHGLERRALMHSFDHPTVRRVRELAPDLPTSVNYGGGTFVDALALARAADASGLGAWWAWLSPEVCAAAHRAAMHAHAWGMDQPPRGEEVAMLVRAGVDTLDADDPRLLRRILDSL